MTVLPGPHVRRDGRGDLLLGGLRAVDLLARYGSPAVVFLPGRVEQNLTELTAAFAARFADVRSFYAVKACYLPPVLAAARAAGAGVEIMSELELDLAARAGFPGADMIVNGLGRTPSFVEAALAARPLLYVIDTAEDLAAAATTARRLGVEVAVGLRLALPSGHGQDTKLGLRPGREFTGMLRRVAAEPGLRPAGLLVHQFSHLTDPAVLGRHLGLVAGFLAELRRTEGLELELLDLGGGFDSRLALERAGVTPADFAAAAAAALGRTPPRILLEPGRLAVADAAVGLTRVVARKERDDFTWLIVDLATNMLVPIEGSRFPPVPLTSGGPVARVRLADRSCAVTVVHGDVDLPADADTLAILNAGAYTTSFAHVWGPPSPLVLSVDAAGEVDVLLDPAGHELVAATMHGSRPGVAVP